MDVVTALRGGLVIAALAVVITTPELVGALLLLGAIVALSKATLEPHTSRLPEPGRTVIDSTAESLPAKPQKRGRRKHV